MGRRHQHVIFHVTRCYMKKNAGRTWISFIGIFLMVTLMTCVFVGKDTVLAYLTDTAQHYYGKWHAAAYDINADQYAALRQTPYVLETAVSENRQCTLFEQSGKASRPYLNVRRYSQKAFDWADIRVAEGRLPECPGEAVLSVDAVTDGGHIAIGDTIHVETFYRQIENFGDTDSVFPFQQLIIGAGETAEVSGSFPYYEEGHVFYEKHREIRVPEGYQDDLTIVGYIKAPLYEQPSSSAYTLLAWMDPEEIPSGTFNCFVMTDQRRLPSMASRDLSQRMGIDESQVEINDAVMAFSGKSSDNTVNELVLMAQIFFTVLIILTAVILISNLFALSYEERCRYLGMLSSVGATSAQKRSSVYYEAFSLLLPALPLGIAFGTLVSLAGTKLLGPMAGKMLVPDAAAAVSESAVRPVLTWHSLLFVIVISSLTVLIAAMRPARRISKIGPIESIRGNDDRKASAKKHIFSNASGTGSARFGAIPMLAFGFVRVQRKKSSGIVKALAIFLIVLTVTAYGAAAISGMVKYKLTESVTYQTLDPEAHAYGLMVDCASETGSGLADAMRDIPGITDLRMNYSSTWVGQVDTSCYSRVWWESLYEIYGMYYPEGLDRAEFEANYVTDRMNFVNMIAVDDTTFAEMTDAVGGTIPETAQDPCIVFNVGEMSTESQIIFRRKASGYRFYEVTPMTDAGIGEVLPMQVYYQDPQGEAALEEIGLTICGFGDNASLGRWLAIHHDELWVITKLETAQKVAALWGSEEHGMYLTVYFNADESVPEAAQALRTLRQMDDVIFLNEGSGITVSMQEVIGRMIRILMIAFTLFASLICCLNMYNAVSGMMISRRREFAMLRSVGMTAGQIMRMSCLELAMLCIRSLIAGGIVSGLLCLCINRFLVGRFGRFTVPFPTGLIIGAALFSVAALFIMECGCGLREQKSGLMEEIRRDGV